jgi:hypothetical protein
MSYVLMALSSNAGFHTMIALAAFVLGCSLGLFYREIIRTGSRQAQYRELAWLVISDRPPPVAPPRAGLTSGLPKSVLARQNKTRPS